MVLGFAFCPPPFAGWNYKNVCHLESLFCKISIFVFWLGLRIRLRFEILDKQVSNQNGRMSWHDFVSLTCPFFFLLTLLVYTPWSSWLPPSSTLHLSSLLICLDFLAWTIQKSSPCLYSSHLSSPSSFLSPRLLRRHPSVRRPEGLVPDSQRHRDHQRAREAPKPQRALQSDAGCKHGLKGKHG